MLEYLAIGWRQGLLAIVALLVLYVAFVAIRLGQIRSRGTAHASSEFREPSALAERAPETLPFATLFSDVPSRTSSTAMSDMATDASAKPSFPWNEPPIEPTVSNAAGSQHERARYAALDPTVLRRLMAAESELMVLRDYVMALRSELEQIREEMQEKLRGAQQSELDEPPNGLLNEQFKQQLQLVAQEDLCTEFMFKPDPVQAAQPVALVDGDAMQMALAGYDAAAIVVRCGVARAEADLVVAMIRNQKSNSGGNDAGSNGQIQ